MGRTALYRHFDADGKLLYVGISNDALRRLLQHKDRSHWFETIAQVDIEWLGGRETALAAEAIAIAKECPAWNVARPAAAGRRSWPSASATNEVRVRGEDLHAACFLGTQWAVTDYGIECRDGTYAIPERRLLERRGGKYEWPEHMLEKEWVDGDDFVKVFVAACWILLAVRVVGLKIGARP